jgi:hypothetical protein
MTSKPNEPKNITLNGTEFVVYRFTGRNTLRMLEKITKTIIPIGASLYEAVDDNTKIGSIDQALKAAYCNLGIDEAYPFIKEIISETNINDKGKKKKIDDMVFDEEFSGNLKSLFSLIKFIIVEVNYKDFFPEGGIGKAIQDYTKKMQA